MFTMFDVRQLWNRYKTAIPYLASLRSRLVFITGLRALSGVISGVFISKVFTEKVAAYLLISNSDAVVTAIMLGFLLMACIIIYSFAVKSMLRMFTVLGSAVFLSFLVRTLL